MFDTQFMHLVLRLLLTAFLGGIIGLERSAGDRPAGLRTHVLVATGSALLMIVSIYGIDGHPLNRDPSRIASQVVTGVGFLGAGTILHEGLTVKGLTTAASVWMVCFCHWAYRWLRYAWSGGRGYHRVPHYLDGHSGNRKKKSFLRDAM